MRKQDLISEFEFKNDLYRVYELDENDSDYDTIVRESKKGKYVESTKNVKKILDLDIEKQFLVLNWCYVENKNAQIIDFKRFFD